MSSVPTPAHGVIIFHTDWFGRRIYNIYVAERLPYGTQTADRIRRLLGLPSLREMQLRTQLYALPDVESPYLWSSPRRSEEPYYEFSTHLYPPLPNERPNSISQDAQTFIQAVTIDAGVKKIFMDAYGWWSCEMQRQNSSDHSCSLPTPEG